MNSDEMVGIETPWLATMGSDGQWHMARKAEFAEWSQQTFGAGEQAMFVPVPLTDAGFHAAAFRYLHGCVLPLIAYHGLHEPDYEIAWETIAARFLPLVWLGDGKVGRKSTAIDKMPCAELCDLIDRIVASASDPDGMNLTIPMADKNWKWAREAARRSAPEQGAGHVQSAVAEECSSIADDSGRTLAGVEPVATPGAGR